MLLTLAFLSGLFGGSDEDKKKKEKQKKELNRKMYAHGYTQSLFHIAFCSVDSVVNSDYVSVTGHLCMSRGNFSSRTVVVDYQVVNTLYCVFFHNYTFDFIH